MISEISCGGHSAIVRMQLLFNAIAIPIAQMGPDYIIIKAACDHPPCDASIVLKVDDNERRWNVHLPDGISARSRRVPIMPPRSLVA